MKATPKEVRAARAFLFAKGIRPADVHPRKFANAAKELGIGFQQLLQFIARMYAAGQGEAFWRREAIQAEAMKSLGRS
jgi:hypothetical protein